MHAHWLPGIDDGAKTLDDSLAMIRALRDGGYRHLIATPHIMSDYYQNTPDIIRQRLAEVRVVCADEGLDITLDAAAEYLVDEGFEHHLETYGALTLPGNRVLIEFGFYQPPRNASSVIFHLFTAGYRVVLAHPERYAYYHNDPTFINQLVEQGVELQVNLLSLTGHYGRSVMKFAQNLLISGKVTYLGTDAHRVSHVEALAGLFKRRKTTKLITQSQFANRELINTTL